MTEQILTPIELNDDELLAVSGGAVAVVGIAQAIHQEAAVVQYGGLFLAGCQRGSRGARASSHHGARASRVHGSPTDGGSASPLAIRGSLVTGQLALAPRGSGSGHSTLGPLSTMRGGYRAVCSDTQPGSCAERLNPGHSL